MDKMKFETITRPNDPEVAFAIRTLVGMSNAFEKGNHPDSKEIVEKFKIFINFLSEYM